MSKELKIVYQNHKPYGIRDDTGFLFFFAKISRFSDQDERYREEIEEKHKLADKLLGFLQAQVETRAVEGKEETEKLYKCDVPGCNVMRTKAQGGNIFTVCDEHWDKR